MMSQAEIEKAISARTVLEDFDGETGVPVEWDTDGETMAVHLVGKNFSRWTDSLDLQPA